MPEGGAIKGMSPNNISIKPQGRIEGVESDAPGKESRTSIKDQSPGANKALTGAKKGAGAEVKGARAGAENGLQSQAGHSNNANSIADTFKTGRGQNVDKFA